MKSVVSSTILAPLSRFVALRSGFTPLLGLDDMNDLLSLHPAFTCCGTLTNCVLSLVDYSPVIDRPLAWSPTLVLEPAFMYITQLVYFA